MEADSIQSTETYIKVLEWFHANRKALIIGAGAVVVIALVIGIMTWQKNAAESDADAQLMTVPLTSMQDGHVVSAPASALLKVSQEHPDTSAGEYAELLAGESYFLDGKYPEAHQEFSKFIEDHPISPLLAEAKIGLAASLEGEGKIQEAAQKYQEVVLTYPTEENIVSPVKLTLARLDEQLKKPEQALQYYEDLARIQNPYDPWAAEARERGTLLLMRHPELRKAPPPSPSAAASPGSQLLNLGNPSQKPPAAPPGKP
jgi:predicted negative regulator of RcsB-dependent stress response